MKLSLRVMLILPVLACGPEYGPPPDIPDSATVCEGSCIILEHFDCPEGGPTLEQCQAKCEHVHKLGYLWPDDKSGPECVVKNGETLSGVRSCNVECAH